METERKMLNAKMMQVLKARKLVQTDKEAFEGIVAERTFYRWMKENSTFKREMKRMASWCAEEATPTAIRVVDDSELYNELYLVAMDEDTKDADAIKAAKEMLDRGTGLFKDEHYTDTHKAILGWVHPPVYKATEPDAEAAKLMAEVLRRIERGEDRDWGSLFGASLTAKRVASRNEYPELFEGIPEKYFEPDYKNASGQ